MLQDKDRVATQAKVPPVKRLDVSKGRRAAVAGVAVARKFHSVANSSDLRLRFKSCWG